MNVLGRFCSLEGSQIELIDSNVIPSSLQKLRKELIDTNVIKDGIYRRNNFSSPSYAAALL